MAFPNELMQEQPDSPRIREDDAYLRVERRYKVKGRFTLTSLEQGEYLPSEGYVDPETGAVFVNYDYDSEVAYPVVVIQFEKRLEPDALYNDHEFTFERPIEQFADFLMKWTYDLYCVDDTTAVPAWAATAQDKSDTEDQKVWAWSKRGAPSGYPYLRQSKTKSGVTSYLVIGARIQKRKVYTNKADAIRWSDQVGFLCEPAERYNLGQGYEKWLIRDYRIVQDRNGWATTVEFLYSEEGWDTDIYSQAGVTDDGL
jgi:hypothetical protein